MVLITRLGDFHTQLWAATLLSLLLLTMRQWRAATFAVSTLLGTALANGALKATFARLRPEVLSEPLTSYSFPSGHSSAAFAFFLVLGVLAGREQPPRMRLTWLLLACLPATAIALSRMYLGVHWATDVLAGALLAATLCATSLTLVQWHRRYRRSARVSGGCYCRPAWGCSAPSPPGACRMRCSSTTTWPADLR